MSYGGDEDNYIWARIEVATTVSEVLDVLQQWYNWGNYDGTGAQILTKLGDIGQGDLAAIAALSKSSMGNIAKTRFAAQNALSSLAQKGDLLASEALNKSLAYWKQQKSCSIIPIDRTLSFDQKNLGFSTAKIKLCL